MPLTKTYKMMLMILSEYYTVNVGCEKQSFLNISIASEASKQKLCMKYTIIGKLLTK